MEQAHTGGTSQHKVTYYFYYTGHQARLTSYNNHVEPLYQVLPQSRHRSQKDEIVNIRFGIDKAIREHASSLGPHGFPLR